MPLHRLGILASIFTCIICVPALAEPLREYPEFRYHAGVPGNGLAVSPKGRIGMCGATQMAIPVAYTPCRGNWLITPQIGCENASLSLKYHGDEVNSTLNIAGGFGNPGRGVYVANMVVDDQGNSAYCAQWQLCEDTRQSPAIAIGGIDLDNQRTDTLDDIYADGGRSFYVVATKEIDDGDTPIYATIGVGNCRYDGIFGGLSFMASKRLAFSAEYDSIGINACMLWDLAISGHGENCIFSLGLAEMTDISYGITYVIAKH